MVNFALLASAAAFVATGIASPVLVQPRQSDDTSIFNSNTPDSDEIKALKSALVSAPSYGDRQAKLFPNPPDASNIVFQFINNTVEGTTGGTIALSTLNNFPAYIGTNVAMAIGFVNPCGLNVPHSHPRASEMLTVVQGELIGGLVLEINDGSFGEVVGEDPPESGAIPSVETRLSNYKGMLFPQGETHWQFNPTCEPALFAAAFDSSDPGRTQIARNFYSNLPDEVIEASLGGGEVLSAKQIDEIREHIPNSYAVLMEECAAKCGL